MQAVFIQGIPLVMTEKLKILLPSAPGYISMKEIPQSDNSSTTFFCKLEDESLIELQDYLKDVFPDMPFEIKEATKL